MFVLEARANAHIAVGGRGRPLPPPPVPLLQPAQDGLALVQGLLHRALHPNLWRRLIKRHR